MGTQWVSGTIDEPNRMKMDKIGYFVVIGYKTAKNG
jgi:hypothetical protein